MSTGRDACQGYRAERSGMDEVKALKMSIAMETTAFPLCVQRYVGCLPLGKSSSYLKSVMQSASEVPGAAPAGSQHYLDRATAVSAAEELACSLVG